jgi:hypothetical protein
MAAGSMPGKQQTASMLARVEASSLPAKNATLSLGIPKGENWAIIVDNQE